MSSDFEYRVSGRHAATLLSASAFVAVLGSMMEGALILSPWRTARVIPLDETGLIRFVECNDRTDVAKRLKSGNATDISALNLPPVSKFPSLLHEKKG